MHIDLIRYVSAAEEAAQEIMEEKGVKAEDLTTSGASAASLIKSPRDSVLFRCVVDSPIQYTMRGYLIIGHRHLLLLLLLLLLVEVRK